MNIGDYGFKLILKDDNVTELNINQIIPLSPEERELIVYHNGDVLAYGDIHYKNVCIEIWIEKCEGSKSYFHQFKIAEGSTYRDILVEMGNYFTRIEADFKLRIESLSCGIERMNNLNKAISKCI